MPFEDPEGATPLGADEKAGLKFAHVTTRHELNELEQANIETGLEWLRKSRGDILDHLFLNTLHYKLFGDVWQWAGAYRLREMNIGVAPMQIGVSVQELLGNVRYWTEHQTYTPLEAAARFHHRLVQIHLYPNGNGRHARIATDAFLIDKHKHKAIDWAGGHDLQIDSERRKQYITSLRAADAGVYDQLFEFAGMR